MGIACFIGVLSSIPCSPNTTTITDKPPWRKAKRAGGEAVIDNAGMSLQDTLLLG